MEGYTLVIFIVGVAVTVSIHFWSLYKEQDKRILALGKAIVKHGDNQIRSNGQKEALLQDFSRGVRILEEKFTVLAEMNSGIATNSKALSTYVSKLAKGTRNGLINAERRHAILSTRIRRVERRRYSLRKASHLDKHLY